MKRLLLFVAVALLAWSCSNTCSAGAVCGDGNVVGPGPVPTVTPTPSPLSTPDPCRVDSITVAFNGGAGLPFVSLGATEQLDATPFNSSGEVPKGCNVSRNPAWAANAPICSILGSGFNPFVKGLSVGTCVITASLVWDNRTITSAPFVVEIK